MGDNDNTPFMGDEKTINGILHFWDGDEWEAFTQEALSTSLRVYMLQCETQREEIERLQKVLRTVKHEVNKYDY